METREYYCFDRRCPFFQRGVEHPVDLTAPWPTCERCGARLRGRSFSMAFSGAITRKYSDPNCHGHDREGHWAWRVRSAEDPNRPEPVFIDTWQKQREFCRAEGLMNPRDLPDNVTISANGKQLVNLSRGEMKDLREELQQGGGAKPREVKPLEGVEVEPVEVTPAIASDIGQADKEV